MSFWTKEQKIHIAALLLGSSVLLSRFMGLIRDKIISFWFGASVESDIYFTAFVIPDFINYLLAGAYFSITLIPLLSELFARDEKDGWQFFSCAFLWISVVICVLTLIGELVVPWCVKFVAPGFDKSSLDRLIVFIRIILPAQVFFLTGACFNAILYLRKQFVVPSVAPLVYNGFIIGFGVLLRKYGMIGFCWGVLVGALVGNFLLPLLSAFRGGGVNLRLRLWHPKMKRFIFMALPLMLGQSIVVLDEQFVRIFGSLVGKGAVSHLNYARRLMFVPVGVVAQAAGVASYPFLAELFAKGKLKEFYSLLNKALKNTLFVIVPVTCVMALLAKPIVGIIFQQGRFIMADTLSTSTALRVFLIGVPFWGYQQIFGRGYYAVGNTVIPVVVGTVATVACIPIYFFGAKFIKEAGVALGSVCGVAFYCVGLSLCWVKWMRDSTVFGSIFRCLIRCFAVSGFGVLGSKLVWYLVSTNLKDLNTWELYILECGVKGSIFVFLWFLGATLFMKEMLCDVLPDRVGRRFSSSLKR
ncbi:MAG: murein biosynthesis integral membrane protein MurJ [Deltaproteobacteria bacterium]|nr:murein biosynthesis integral membrane protein MurJ [Deltaproteobacteria bacterium]MBW2067321.1 murein biosynthesis integral membrane protein MurJ [Deltaproteobacteria bacterium]